MKSLAQSARNHSLFLFLASKVHKPMKIKYDFAVMKFISMFESATGAQLQDSFMQNDKIVFVVKQGQIGKALGKKGVNIRKLENLFKKKIRIIEFNDDMLQFVRNAVHPLQIKEITEEAGVITIIPPDTKTRGYLIGRGAANLRNT
jgi:N utilization substance protein A